MFGIFAILLLITFGIARHAKQRFETAVKQGRRFSIPNGRTAGELVREFLDAEDAGDVQIMEHNAMVSDYFDPKRRCLFLNAAVMNGTDAGSLAIALHEAAHALQTGDAKSALDWRLNSIRITRYAPTVIGLTFLTLMVVKRMPFRSVLMIVSVMWFLIMIMNVMSMPIEVNASNRALAYLERKLAKHPSFVEIMTTLLRGVAFRVTAAFLRSPMYCLAGLMPVGGKLRPMK